MHRSAKTRYHTSEIGVFSKMIAPLAIRSADEEARLNAVLDFVKQNSNDLGLLNNVDLAMMRVNGP